MSMQGRYELQDCAAWIRQKGFVSVALQFNEEDRIDSVQVVKELTVLTDNQVEFYVVLSPSCSVDYLGHLHLGDSVCDAIICFNIKCLSKTQSSLGKLPVLFVFSPHRGINADSLSSLRSQVNAFNVIQDNLLVLYDLQHLSTVNDLFVNDTDSREHIGKIANVGSNWHFNDKLSWLIGTNQEHQFAHFTLSRPIESFDGVVWIGKCSNLFIKANSPKRIVQIELDSSEPIETKTQKELMKRAAAIEKAKQAEKIGVVISNSLPSVGELFEKLSELSSKSNKEAYFISLVQFADETKFGNFGELDLFVIVTSCNCYQLINNVKTNVPLITLLEYEIALGLKRSYGNIVWNEDGPDMASLLPEAEPNIDSNSKELMAYEQSMKGSWYGLKVEAGQHEITKARQGLKGVASGYSEEPK